MKGRDPIAEKLLGPLVDEYASSAADRARVRESLRARLGESVLASSATANAQGAGEARAVRPLLGRGAAALGAGVLVVLGVVVSQTRVAPLPVASPAPVVVAPRAPAETPPPAAVPSEEPVVSVEALPPAPLPTASPLAAPSLGEDPLVKETRLMGRANDAARAGDHVRALALFDEHAREFPHGVLTEERAVGHILALCSLGRQDEATIEARQFLGAHPASALTRRIVSSCAGPANTETQ